MRDDVLSNELRDRLEEDRAELRQWFRSLRPPDRLRLVSIMNEQIKEALGQRDEEHIRKDRLEIINRLFITWIDAEPS